MTRGLFLVLLFLFPLLPSSAGAQVVPPAIQQELNQRNMSQAEARAMAQQLGINLNDPVQAAQRARELGVPESTIQEMLNAIKTQDEEAAASAVIGTVAVDPSDPGGLPASDTLSSVVLEQALEAGLLRDIEEAGSETVLEEEARAQDLEFFGYDLFESVPDAFQPNAAGPVDDAYVIGPGDELRLAVWGAAEFGYELTVDAGGRIFLPRVGQFLASGSRLNTLRVSLKRFLSRSYAGLSTDPPTVFMDLTVSRIRPVQVYVLGEVSRPGGYTISANASGFNVLYATGGPLTRGSLRAIEILRNGRRIGGLDLYNYLLKGFERNPVRLQTNDFVFVPPRGKTVAVSGSVRRPAVFELKGDEDFADLLDFAGGLLPEAYTKRFQIERIVPYAERTDPSIARQILDLSLSEALSGRLKVDLRDGDVVQITSITDRIDNAASIDGAVFQPGHYQLDGSLITIRDLILAADGLTELAFRDQATLIRLTDDYTEETVTLDLTRVLADDPRHNLPLRPRDRLQVQSRDQVQSAGSITVSGNVRTPGTQPYRTGLTLRNALFAAGGLQDSLFIKDVFLARADLYRRDGLRQRPVIIPFSLEDAIAGEGSAGLVLIPGDEIRVYPRSVGEISGTSIDISGAVGAPGVKPYREGMTVEDAILQAGGLTQFAHLESVRVARPDPDGLKLASVFEVPLVGLSRDASGIVDPAAVRAALGARTYLLQPGDQVTVFTDPTYRPVQTVSISGEVQFPGLFAIESSDETISSALRRAGGALATAYLGGARLTRGGDEVAVDFERAVAGGRGDMRLLPGDQLVVPRRPNTVRVSGNVNRASLIRYVAGKRVSYYLDRAGGEGEDRGGVYVTQADGTTRRLRGGLFPSNPIVTDGAEISVTTKTPKPAEERVDVGRVITDTVSVLTAALTAILLATRL
ncbi:MAG: polysaccharide export outer membrane protein [Rhodothermales bacterium]|jgi:polysaccharide export outer membrane protein